jgi:hypothetical protein
VFGWLRVASEPGAQGAPGYANFGSDFAAVIFGFAQVGNDTGPAAPYQSFLGCRPVPGDQVAPLMRSSRECIRWNEIASGLRWAWCRPMHALGDLSFS